MARPYPPPMTLDEWTAEVRRLLEAGETVEFSPKGLSMWPTLRPATDTVRVRAAAAYRPGDMLLAVTEGHGTVLHRLRRVEAGRFILMGDANLRQTEVCAPEAVLGKVVAVYRRGRDVTDGAAMRLLGRLHAAPAPLRRVAVRLLHGVAASLPPKRRR